ncbi:LexA family transcriptional regulator [Grimontia hollisae]|uniref:Uncharacterized HTH-type transcriptional regulator HI_1476 n=1 Tax=Grimontia hollisae TaxID=673 RepID=A0A377HNL7_GRIHO|nr:XRE family transcriptional regulator [Grimontia hollisae]MDF2186179.1 XRE family transcriptional regulator [Grimontia hollisae]STO57593.1 Uncharacterized HTH-type transcriptional regulator HI_1476 [Grimontia hollisae]
MNSLTDRLKYIIGDQSIRSFASKVGVSETMIRKYLKGGMPGLDIAAKICLVGGISVHWFATGEGEIFTGDAVTDFDQMARQAVTTIDSEEFVLVEGYHITVDEMDNTEQSAAPVRRKLAFRKKWLEYRGLKSESLRIYFVKSYVEGGIISGGDSVMIDMSDTSVSDGVLALKLNGNMLIRWIKVRVDGSVDVYTDINKEPDENVGADKLQNIEVLGRVVWLGKDFK